MSITQISNLFFGQILIAPPSSLLFTAQAEHIHQFFAWMYSCFARSLFSSRTVQPITPTVFHSEAEKKNEGCDQSHGTKAQIDRMAKNEARTILRAIDLTADRPSTVTDGQHEGQCRGSFGMRTDVARDESNARGDTGRDATGGEKDGKVFHVQVFRDDQDDKANNTDRQPTENENSSFSESIGEVSGGHRRQK